MRIIWKKFGYIKQEYISWLRFSESIVVLANDTNFTACISSSNHPDKARPTLTDLNPHQGLC